MNFHSHLTRGWAFSQSLLCVGIDPRVDMLPESFDQDRDSILEFCKSLVDCTSQLACAFKPNHAFFAALGLEDELADLIEYIHAHSVHTPVVLDAKRGDIGSTAEYYAKEVFERFNADAVTVNPFLGWETLEPFMAYEERGVFVLCRTSDPSSAWLQNQPAAVPIYKQIAKRVAALNNPNVGLVVGATSLDELREIRELAPNALLLIPGVGMQGATSKDVIEAGCAKDGRKVLINVSRGIIHQDRSADYTQSVRLKAASYQQQMRVLTP